MIAYKLLYRDQDNRLWSFLKGLSTVYYGIEYFNNEEWIEPLFGKLFAFTDLNSAIRHNLNNRWEVWEVEVENPTELEGCAKYYHKIALLNFWNLYSETCPTLKGTIVCDKMKLISRVI